MIQIRNIDGLDPVKAAVNTTPFGSVDGASYMGSSIPTRNIVLTIHPNPDWDIWSHESLRRLIYSYFMPKKRTRLVFYSDDMVPVEIWGIVESVSNNMFSKDPELFVSILCPDPHFTASSGVVMTGQTVRPGGLKTNIPYNGNVEAGVRIKVSAVSGTAPTIIEIQMGNPAISYFIVPSTIAPLMYFEMSSFPLNKFVQNINLGSGIITNLLSKVQDGSSWPILEPGTSEFSVITDQGIQDWELTYFERFGGL